MWVAILLLTLPGCNGKRAFDPKTVTYRVSERVDKHEDKQGGYVEEGRPYVHNAVYLALTHDKTRIFGQCRGDCDMQPGRDYVCTTRLNGLEAVVPPLPEADLVCRDGQDRKVFVHALSQH